MNNLLAKHRLRILQHPRDNSLVYQEVIQEEAAKYDPTSHPPLWHAQ